MSVTDLTTGLSKGLPTDLVGNTVMDYGDQALMLQCGSTAEVLAWADALRGAALPGVIDIVPAARTVLVKLDNPRFQGVTRRRLRRMRVAADVDAPADRSAAAVAATWAAAAPNVIVPSSVRSQMPSGSRRAASVRTSGIVR